MIRLPIVRMIRQPPVQVPSAIAVADVTTTQSGTSKWSGLMFPCATSASVMMPIVFWASFVPCDSASSPEDSHWPSR